MPLSSDDLKQIRKIVREEIERALAVKNGDADDEQSAARLLGEKDVRTGFERLFNSPHHLELKRKRQERAALPIPDGPFVDIYDARRLLAVTKVTANAWMRRGRLKRTRVNGCLQISRAEIDAILAEHKK